MDDGRHTEVEEAQRDRRHIAVDQISIEYRSSDRHLRCQTFVDQLKSLGGGNRWTDHKPTLVLDLGHNGHRDQDFVFDDDDDGAAVLSLFLRDVPFGRPWDKGDRVTATP